MALTPEQQAFMDQQFLLEKARKELDKELEVIRSDNIIKHAEQKKLIDLEINRSLAEIQHTNNINLENKRARLEAIRLAKEVLLENARSKPVDSREVSVDDIQQYANNLLKFIDS